jgi:sterol desaturase/sphingolipid hydroxylase (fatty acid hydroxylase superfamily)
MTKLEVLAIPAYFATMGAEYVHHRSRVQRGVTLPGDYERRDTLTSLTMGTASLAIPLVAPKLLAPFTPGKGRYGKAVVAGALAVVAATTAADAVVRNADAAERAERKAGGPSPDEAPAARIGREKRRRRARLARKVARVGGVASVAAGVGAMTTAWGHLTRPAAMWQRRLLPDLGSGALAWAVAVVGWDALYYANHRIWHETRFMWANHVMHHSSERYNLSTALRQAVTDPFLFLVPYTSLSLLGVRPELVASSRSINLLYQYWVHTDAIDRLGPLEEFANTPSHHRAHHGVNPQYIDRNHGGILIIWDRLFGTFEREDETVVYGLTKNINTFNPLRVASHEYADIFRDVANSTTWRDRFSFVFRGPGWAYDRHRADAEARTDERRRAVSSSRPAGLTDAPYEADRSDRYVAARPAG